MKAKLKIVPPLLASPFNLGYTARSDGLRMDQNPFSGTKEGRDWAQGYDIADSDMDVSEGV